MGVPINAVHDDVVVRPGNLTVEIPSIHPNAKRNKILIAVSKRININFEQVLASPITHYLLSLTHSDGFMIKTDKAKLLKKFKEFQVGFTGKQIPPIDVTLIDQGLLIHS